MDDYIPYNPETILALCKLMPRFESIREKGMLILTPPVEYKSKKEDRKDWYEVTSVEMWHRPYRKGNTVYRIDDVGPIMIDFDRALASLSDKSRARIELHFLHGYTRSELADMEGVSESAIKNSITRAIENMAEWLETPRPAVKQLGRNVNEREETYRRKYATHPQ
jgi:predicted DNA-binding protein YlxM (UPF0122 family)